MVVALFVVAFAMIVAGGAAIYDGSAIVLMEKGWTKVISGTVGASAGFVLVGIACLLLELKRLGASLPERAVLPGPLPLPPRTPAAEPHPVTAVPPAAGEETPADARPSEPPRDAEPAVAAEPAPLAPAGPSISPTPPPAETERAPEPVEPRDVARAPDAAPSYETPREDPAGIVVGTYASGGNTYVMYADGSIQADTPTGRYRFDSLDELKGFIAAGGESGVPPQNAGRRT